MAMIAQSGVLVPGAAGAAGIDAIRLLKDAGCGYKIVAIDPEPLAAGFAFADAHYVSHLTQKSFPETLSLLCREGIRVILPTSASDSPIYAANWAELRNRDIRFAGSDFKVIRLCDDKLSFYEAIQGEFPVPRLIQVGQNGPLEYPCFVKPRFGAGSRGAMLCGCEGDWLYAARRYPNLIAQEFLPGPEYSVDVLSDLSGRALAAIPRERLSILDGVSSRMRIFRDPELQDMCLKLAEHLDLRGGSCIQLKRDEAGKIRVQEVNARLGASSSAVSLAGVNLPLAIALIALGEKPHIPSFNEITVVRYFDQVIL